MSSLRAEVPLVDGGLESTLVQGPSVLTSGGGRVPRFHPPHLSSPSIAILPESLHKPQILRLRSDLVEPRLQEECTGCSHTHFPGDFDACWSLRTTGLDNYPVIS